MERGSPPIGSDHGLDSEVAEADWIQPVEIAVMTIPGPWQPRYRRSVWTLRPVALRPCLTTGLPFVSTGIG